MTNVVLNPGSGGNTIATDTVAGVDAQIVKIGFSVAGAAPVQTSASNPLPVTIAGGAITGIADQGAFTAGTTVGLPAFGLYSDAATISTGDAGAIRMTALRQLLIGAQAVPVGGCLPGVFVLANSNNATLVKSTPGNLYNIQVFNLTGTLFYLKFYNKASSPAPATDNALLVKVIPVPANSSGAGVAIDFSTPIFFSTGIALAVVANVSNTDNTSVPSNAGVVNYGYF